MLGATSSPDDGETCCERLFDKDSSGNSRGFSFGKKNNSISVTILIVAIILAYRTNLNGRLSHNVARDTVQWRILLSDTETNSSAKDLNQSLYNHSNQSVAEEGNTSSGFRNTNCHLSVRRTIAKLVKSHIRDKACICDVDIREETHHK